MFRITSKVSSAVLLVALAAAHVAASAQVGADGRTTVPSQHAWRLNYGDDPTSPPESGPDTGVFPHGLKD